jgi:phage-related protein
MVEAILSYVIKAIDESSSVMDKIKSSVGLLGSSLSELGGGFTAVGSVMTGFAAGGVAGAAITALGEVSKGLEWSVKQAADSEQAFKNLAEAVERSGTSWTSVGGATRQYLTQLQATTVYSDEALAGIVERLLTFGLTYDQAMKAAGAALDLAAAKHMDLESAASLVGKAIDGNTAILKRYGVDVEVAKDATDKFTPVITALNEQFGGAAQAQAQTYAGIQERLKNATSELGEKIGGILLPGLASITEAMIPVVDQFSEGVDALQAWLTEVGKMPEVQGAVAAVSDAFSGLWKYLEGLWNFFVEQMGPALTELMGAFKDLWDALSPIGDALKELLGAFGDTGNLDLFKATITLIAIEIRGIAAIIKEVAPYIKMFAQAFKDAADFITPILTTMGSDIRTFLDSLEKAFQDFYSWLIGASLWRELWNAMATLTNEMISRLLTAIRDTFLHALQTAFETVTAAIKNAWNTAWTAMQIIFTTITTSIGTAWTNWANSMQTMMMNFWSAVQTATTTALNMIQAVFSAGMMAIQGILSSAISAMEGTWQAFASFMSGAISAWGSSIVSLMTGIMEQLKGVVSGGVAAIQGMFNSLVGSAQSAMGQVQSLFSQAQSMASQAQSLVSSAAAVVSQPVTTIGTTIASSVSSAVQDLSNTAAAAANAARAGYDWTIAVADYGLTYAKQIAKLLTGVPSYQTVPGESVQVARSGLAVVHEGETVSRSSSSYNPLSLTIPVMVKVDGQTVTRQVETRIVNSIQNRATRRA